MNASDSQVIGSVDGLVAGGAAIEDTYSLYTGLASRRWFRLRVSGSSLRNVLCALLTNVAVSVLLIITVLSVSLGLGLYALLHVQPPPVIDISLKAFSIPNHEVTRHQEAFDIAVDEYKQWLKGHHRFIRSVLDSKETNVHRHRRYAAAVTQYSPRQRVLLVYLAIGGTSNNIFTRERIKTIHRIETDVVRMPGFSELCFKGYPQQRDGVQRCHALNSLVSKYFYRQFSDPVQHGDDVQLVNDFGGAVREALSSPDGFLFTDGHASQTYFKSTFLRSEITFGVPLPGYRDIDDRKEEQETKFKQFLPHLVEKLSDLSTDEVRVLYGGNDIFDYEVSSAFWHDIRLAIISVVTIVVLMLVLTSFSVWLTFWGIVTIVLSFPLAYFFYRVVFNVVALGMLNGAAAFVVVGIGVDDVFVFINTFRQAHSISSLPDRMLHTVKAAGKATFFTSFTTAAAFGANIFSSIPAVHDFGLFMTLIVACCWLLVVLVLPPVINLWFRWFACCETTMYRCCLKTCKSCAVPEIPDDVVNFFNNCHSSAVHCSDDDVGLLQLDSETTVVGHPTTNSHADGDTSGYTNGDCDGGDDVELSAVDRPLRSSNHRLRCRRVGGILRMLSSDDDLHDDNDDALLSLEHELTHGALSGRRHEGCSLNTWLQSIMYHWVALPVLKARWAVIVVFVLVLIASVISMTHLQHATKPPQLFRPDTNVEMLLDLMANYTTQGIPKLPSNYKPDMPTVVMPPRHRVKSTMPWYLRTTAHPQTQKITFPRSTTHTSTVSTSFDKRLSSPSTVHTSLAARDTSTTLLLSDTTTTTASAKSADTVHHIDMLSMSSTMLPSPTHRVTDDSLTHGQMSTPAATANVPQQIHLEKGITVNVVFGIIDIDRSNQTSGHVLSEKGKVIYDESFAAAMNMSHMNASVLSDLCRLCNMIRNNSHLVVPNTAQCLPALSDIHTSRQQSNYASSLINLLSTIDECRRVPRTYVSDGMHRPSHAQVGIYAGKYIKWIAFSFQSTTFKGSSSFSAYGQYQQWQTFVDSLRQTLPHSSPLRSVYQTSQFWNQVIMEIVAVMSAVYGLVLSMVICVIAVALFSGHFILIIITVVTMLGMICLVVAIFFWAGWELGAVEAISLSILVGSSVDYCVHVVEGYLLAGHCPPTHVLQTDSVSTLRRWRTRVAVTHIGTAVISSAVTTVAAAIPLTQAILRPFSRFGEIVAINAAVSVSYSLTVCVALLAVAAPSKFVSRLLSSVIAAGVASAIVATGAGIFYATVHSGGVHIPGPSGTDLFT